MPIEKTHFNECGVNFTANIPPFSPHYLNRLLLESIQFILLATYNNLTLDLLDKYINSLMNRE